MGWRPVLDRPALRLPSAGISGVCGYAQFLVLKTRVLQHHVHKVTILEMVCVYSKQAPPTS